ncbi:MAG: hypothetical protein HEQ13_15085 [Dolichospermum sp. DEX189]|uniref:Uncharacterized protein n=1 Tax=Aphanizomenon flos-aquae FACHB-1040 TaxID=2692887 RepID=A0ABR8C0Q6_APHFL|nr:hypothetical protein [Aphanizomenon flos-aquae]MBD2280068.1 hypothetical protein [Aphanizomenon flos-aquae FACHB-1040]MBO1070605.1 hypothetical protein [Dolichospermum sp. DEX189]
MILYSKQGGGGFWIILQSPITNYQLPITNYQLPITQLSNFRFHNQEHLL